MPKAKAALRVGLVGCGPRGLSVLERVLSLAEQHHEQPVVIDIFDPHEPGSGVHGLDQPEYLFLNTVAGQLGVFPDQASLGNLPEARARKGPSFLSWCRDADIRVSPTNGRLTSQGRKVGPDDFLPRRLLGFYLANAFKEIVASAPSHVVVKVHRESVTTLRTIGPSLFVLQTPSGYCATVDRLVLTVGHTGRLPSRKPEYIEKIYPLPKSLDCVRAGDSVLVEGLGLGAIDVLATLTVGRGGRYEQSADGLVYRPSGHEPVILIQSRDGLPFRARPDGLTRFPRHQAVILTRSRIAHLRKQTGDGRLDFERDILPLMALEMRAAAVAAVLGGSDAGKRQEVLSHLRDAGTDLQVGVEACREWLEKLEAASGSIDPRATLPQTLPAEVTIENYHAWMYDEIAVDFREACRGLESPSKAAGEVWRDLRDQLRDAVDFDGLNESSHQAFYGQWRRKINRLVAGPQKERCAELLALCRAALLTFLHPTVHPAGQPLRISAYVQRSSVGNTDCALIRNLEQLGLVRSRSDLPGSDGMDIDRACHPRSRLGNPVKNIWVLGALAEGSCYYNHYVSSAGVPSRLFMDAHRVAREIYSEPDERGSFNTSGIESPPEQHDAQ